MRDKYKDWVFALLNYVMAFLHNVSGPFIWPEGVCLVTSHLLPLNHPRLPALLHSHTIVIRQFSKIHGFEGFRVLSL